MRCGGLLIMNAKSIRTLLVTVALALCAPAGWSQATLTRADARITDSGKSLPGVQVILSHRDTFEVYRATTDKYGTFSIPEVARGTYIVSVLNAAGDKLFRKTLELTSAPDAPIRLDIDVSGEPPSLALARGRRCSRASRRKERRAARLSYPPVRFCTARRG
jgi:hypothetical protein